MNKLNAKGVGGVKKPIRIVHLETKEEKLFDRQMDCAKFLGICNVRVRTALEAYSKYKVAKEAPWLILRECWEIPDLSAINTKPRRVVEPISYRVTNRSSGEVLELVGYARLSECLGVCQRTARHLAKKGDGKFIHGQFEVERVATVRRTEDAFRFQKGTAYRHRTAAPIQASWPDGTVKVFENGLTGLAKELDVSKGYLSRYISQNGPKYKDVSIQRL